MGESPHLLPKKKKCSLSYCFLLLNSDESLLENPAKFLIEESQERTLGGLLWKCEKKKSQNIHKATPKLGK